MSVQNGERLATKQDLADMYSGILPYLGGIVSSKAEYTPIGTIISVMGTTAPANYLACDGTVYNIADYTELANYFNEQFGSKNFFGGDGTTTFAVPDLRGEFLRGTGTNSHTNQGSGAGVGVHQDSTEYPEYSFNTYAGSINIQYTGTSGEAYAGTKNADTITAYRTWVANIPNNQVVASGGTPSYCTVRPTNTSVLYCIATKNFYIDRPTLEYSTDEKIIGTWVDGKPIWQKTLTGAPFQPLPSSRGDLIFYADSMPSDIENIVNIDGFLYFEVSNLFPDYTGEWIQCRPLGMNDASDSQLFCMTCVSKTSVTVTCRMNSRWFAVSPTLTIQYTKTTD